MGRLEAKWDGIVGEGKIENPMKGMSNTPKPAIPTPQSDLRPLHGVTRLPRKAPQGTQRHVFRGDQRRARIEADAWLARDQWICREAFVLRNIRHDEQTSMMKGVSAESNITRRLRHSQADPAP